MGRKNKREEDKKKKISLSINKSVINIIDEYLNEYNLSRSKLIENLWADYLNKKISNEISNEIL